ncbi:ABC transporter 1 [Fusarium oxysporum f. sp. albedinis]|nr:ABC transporter 1 [Fusarium oxysporum f. sp. albedinis]
MCIPPTSRYLPESENKSTGRNQAICRHQHLLTTLNLPLFSTVSEPSQNDLSRATTKCWSKSSLSAPYDDPTSSERPIKSMSSWTVPKRRVQCRAIVPISAWVFLAQGS